MPLFCNRNIGFKKYIIKILAVKLFIIIKTSFNIKYFRTIIKKITIKNYLFINLIFEYITRFRFVKFSITYED